MTTLTFTPKREAWCLFSIESCAWNKAVDSVFAAMAHEGLGSVAPSCRYLSPFTAPSAVLAPFFAPSAGGCAMNPRFCRSGVVVFVMLFVRSAATFAR